MKKAVKKSVKRKKLSKKKTGVNLKTKIVVVFFLISVFFLLDRAFFYQINPVKESARTEQHKIPEEVKTQLMNPTESFRVPIILYHYVEYVTDKKDITRQSLNIEPYIFEAQIKTLKDNGYTFLTASELGNIIDGERNLPPKPVLITIDDGHDDVDSVILPILKKYHAKATAYVITSFIGRPDFMTHTQLMDVINSNLVEIGAHTVDHVSLKGKFAPVVTHEVSQSKKDLENEYRIRPVSFAYPNGEFDEQAIEAVKAAGFTTAVSTIPGIKQSDQNRYFLYRIRPGYRTGQDLLDYLSQDNFRNW